MRKPSICFRYTDGAISLLRNSEISSFQPSSVLVQLGLCRNWSETQIVGFLMHRLNYGLKMGHFPDFFFLVKIKWFTVITKYFSLFSGFVTRYLL